MARADFYQCSQAGQELVLALRVAEKAYRKGHLVRVLCRDDKHADEVDTALWELRPDAFVPHHRASNIVQTERIGEDPLGLALINLTGQFPRLPDEPWRMVEIIPADPEQRGGSRGRYRRYMELGHQLNVVNA